jgi:hypothetical protein
MMMVYRTRQLTNTFFPSERLLYPRPKRATQKHPLFLQGTNLHPLLTKFGCDTRCAHIS